MCKFNLAMRRLFFILFILFSCKLTIAQYTFRGRVFNELRQQHMTWGNVKLGIAPGKLRNNRNNQTISKIDSLGYFSIVLKDSANVTLIVDCSLDGMAIKTVSFTDTLIIFNIKTTCNEYNIDRAKKDIEKNDIYFLCSLGYATYKFSDADRAFEKKYGINYYSFGDQPIMSDCMWLYNKTIAEYLDKKFGEEWRKEIRQDVPFR